MAITSAFWVITKTRAVWRDGAEGVTRPVVLDEGFFSSGAAAEARADELNAAADADHLWGVGDPFPGASLADVRQIYDKGTYGVEGVGRGTHAIYEGRDDRYEGGLVDPERFPEEQIRADEMALESQGQIWILLNDSFELENEQFVYLTKEDVETHRERMNEASWEWWEDRDPGQADHSFIQFRQEYGAPFRSGALTRRD